MRGCMNRLMKKAALASLVALAACTTASQVLNPFYEPPSKQALLGEANDHALNGATAKGESARQALEAMSTYQRAHAPQPVNPVLEPAMVRLMWVPDHLNKAGDLVPAHFYYLKVKSDQWAVSDAFDREFQLTPEGDKSNIPFVYDGDRSVKQN